MTTMTCSKLACFAEGSTSVCDSHINGLGALGHFEEIVTGLYSEEDQRSGVSSFLKLPFVA